MVDMILNTSNPELLPTVLTNLHLQTLILPRHPCINLIHIYLRLLTTFWPPRTKLFPSNRLGTVIRILTAVTLITAMAIIIIITFKLMFRTTSPTGNMAQIPRLRPATEITATRRNRDMIVVFILLLDTGDSTGDTFYSGDTEDLVLWEGRTCASVTEGMGPRWGRKHCVWRINGWLGMMLRHCLGSEQKRLADLDRWTVEDVNVRRNDPPQTVVAVYLIHITVYPRFSDISD